MVDKSAVRERFETAQMIFLTAMSNGAMPALAVAAMYPSVWEDVQALLAEIDELEHTIECMHEEDRVQSEWREMEP